MVPREARGCNVKVRYLILCCFPIFVNDFCYVILLLFDALEILPQLRRRERGSHRRREDPLNKEGARARWARPSLWNSLVSLLLEKLIKLLCCYGLYLAAFWRQVVGLLDIHDGSAEWDPSPQCLNPGFAALGRRVMGQLDLHEGPCHFD